METLLFELSNQIYIKGLFFSFIILIINRAFIKASKKWALPSLFLGSFFLFTLIVPIYALLHFNHIRLIAEKKRQKEHPIWKTSDK